MTQLDPLRYDLQDLAEEVRLVDLRDRSLATARRIGVRRGVVGVAVAVVVVAVGMTLALLPRTQRALPPAHPSLTGTATDAPSPTDTPTNPPSETLSPPRTSPSLGAWKTTSVASLPGTLFFVLKQPSASGEKVKISVATLHNGQLWTSVLGTFTMGYDCVFQSIEFSPDGTQVLWVLGDNTNGNGGDELMVARLDGSAPRLVARQVSCTGGNGPTWQHDSASIVISTPTGTGSVAVATGQITPLPSTWADYFAWSASGGFRAFGNGSDIVVEDSGGKEVHRVAYHGFDAFTGSLSVQAVSEDGRYVGVSPHNTDPSTVRGVSRVVDVVTGKEIKLPVPGAAGVSNVIFLADGGMLVQTSDAHGAKTLYLVSAAGTVTQTLPLTGSVASASVQVYRP